MVVLAALFAAAVSPDLLVIISPIIASFAAGTFIYVGVLEAIAKQLVAPEDTLLKLVAVVAGTVGMGALSASI